MLLLSLLRIINILLFIKVSGGLVFDVAPLLRVEGAVGPEDFTYFHVNHKGNLILLLETLNGDADIYISEKLTKPDYNPDNYDYHSATCGLDYVYITKGMKRPIAVGIYGYFAHKNSTFIFSIYKMPRNHEDLFIKDILAEETSDTSLPVDSTASQITKKNQKNSLKFRTISRTLWPFLELLELLFF